MPRLPPARIPIEADNKTARGIAGARKNVRGLDKDIKTLAKTAVIATAALSFGRTLKRDLDFLDDIGKVSTQFGIATETISALNHVADQSGISLPVLASAMRLGAKNAGEAAQGFGMARKAFEELNIPVNELIKLPLDKQLGFIIGKLRGVENESERVRLAMTLLGRSGTEVLKVGDSFDSLIEEAHRTGIVFNEDVVRGAEAANDAMEKFNKKLQASRIEMINNMIPAIEDTSNFLTKAIPGAVNFSVEAFQKLTAAGNLALVGLLQGALGVAQAMDQVKSTVSGTTSFMETFAKVASFPLKATPLGPVRDAWLLDKFGIPSPQEASELVQNLQITIEGALARAASLLGDFEATGEEGGFKATIQGGTDAVVELNENLETTKKKMRTIRGRAEKIPHVLTDWEKASKRIGDAMASNLESSFFDRADEGIKGFTKSMLEALARIAFRLATLKILNSAFGFNIEGFAAGGRPQVGRPAIVGERGPELFIPDTAGRIVPNHKLSGGGVSVNQVNTINLSGSGHSERDLAEIMENQRRLLLADVVDAQRRARI